MWSALVPDGELSQFERRILEVHLARCTDCARHAEQLAALVAVVRDTPRESMSSPVEVVRRPRLGWGGVRRIAVGGSAAAAAVAALALSIESTGNRTPAQSVPFPPVIVVNSTQTTNDDVALWRKTRQAKRDQTARQFTPRAPGVKIN